MRERERKKEEGQVAKEKQKQKQKGESCGREESNPRLFGAASGARAGRAPAAGIGGPRAIGGEILNPIVSHNEVFYR